MRLTGSLRSCRREAMNECTCYGAGAGTVAGYGWSRDTGPDATRVPAGHLPHAG